MIDWLTLKMAPIDEAFFNRLRKEAQVLESDAFGEKVLRLADGTFLKIFRRKRLLSSATFIPYSVRFVRNAEKSTPTADGSKKTLKNIFLGYAENNDPRWTLGFFWAK